MWDIEESIKTSVSSKKVWDAWKKVHRWNEKAAPFKKGETGSVVAEKRKIPFLIKDIEDRKKFSLQWHSFFVKILFQYELEEVNNKTIVSCKIKFKGFFSFLVKLFSKKKIRQNIKISLTNFILNLEENK
jgi:hypothetical protein